MLHQETEQSTSQMNVESTHNLTSSPKKQLREQFKDSAIWIIDDDTIHIAVIGDQIIYKGNNFEDVLNELNNPTIKTICLIAAVVGHKILHEYIRDKEE